MDILKHIEGSAPKIAVPLISAPENDSGSFIDFPRSRDFLLNETSDCLELMLTEGHSYEEYTSLLQAWLYFNLVRCFCSELQLSVNLGHFVGQGIDHWIGLGQHHNHKPLVTASPPFKGLLKQLQDQCLSPMRRMEFFTAGYTDRRLVIGDRHTNFQNLEQNLKIALHNSAIFDFDDLSSDKSSEDRARVILSVKYLVYFLESIISSRRPPFDNYRDASHEFLGGINTNDDIREQRLLCADDEQDIQPSGNILKQYLVGNGWCPVLAEDILRRQSLDHVYRALVRVGYHDKSVVHDHCTLAAGCVAYNVKLDDLQPRHCQSPCSCSVIKPDIEKVYAILARGEIPVAKLHRNRKHHTLSIEITPAIPGLSYVAISHVWADGLASARYNGLYLCQLEKVFDRISHLETSWSPPSKSSSNVNVAYPRKKLMKWVKKWTPKSSVVLWMDALCVPVVDHNDLNRSKLMKQRAINLMTPTYAGASSVLVLDRRVEELPSWSWGHNSYRTDNSSTLLYVLRYSAWMGRCWTLQEGALGQFVVCQCKDSVAPIPKNLLEEVESGRTQALLESLLSRATSMKADLFQILANLSLLSADELAKLTPANRVKAFLMAKRADLPISLLLRRLTDVPQGPRGEWWIPDLDSRASFYSCGKQSKVVTLCDQGLVLQTWQNGFWENDPYSILACSVQLNGTGKGAFWLQYNCTWLWLVFDLDIAHFKDTSNPYRPSTVILLIPYRGPRENARGFIGRGLCLKQTRDVQIALSHDGHNVPSRAWPTMYNCALSVGIMTPSSSFEFAGGPVIHDPCIYPSNDTDQTFLIESDTTGWPRVNVVRDAKLSWFVKHRVMRAPYFFLLAVLGFGVFVGVFAGATSACPDDNFDEHERCYRRWIRVGLPIAMSVWAFVVMLLILKLLRNIRRRRRAYDSWVKSFSVQSPL